MIDLLKSIRQSIKHWYLLLILGIILILCGIFVISRPLSAYLALSVFFSITLIITGLMESIFAISNHRILKGWMWYLIGGILSVIFGAYLLAHPKISMNVLTLIIGFSLMLRSYQLLAFSFDLRDLKIKKWKNTALISILGIIFSLLLLSNPIFTAVSVMFVTSFAFIFVGISYCVFSFSLRKIKRKTAKISKELQERLRTIEAEIIEEIED